MYTYIHIHISIYVYMYTYIYTHKYIERASPARPNQSIPINLYMYVPLQVDIFQKRT